MFLTLIILIAAACGVREHWTRVAETPRAADRRLFEWFVKGAVFPSFIWALATFGISESFPALIPKIALAQAAGQKWWHLWTAHTVRGAGFIALCWVSITYTWLAFIVAHRAVNDGEFRVTAALTLGPFFLLALIIVNREAWTMLPYGLVILCLPFVHATAAVVEKLEPVPMYGAAKGKINFGRYQDAELEVINQLEKKENDFNGWMMLAELYATKYRRLDDAAQVIVDLCNDPTVKEMEISLACNKLADWQLEFGMNPAAARAALDLLIQSLPGSHAASMAEVRLKQIPRTREDFLDQKKPRAIRLPSLREEFAEQPASARPVTKTEATLEANRMSDRLRDNPNDIPARERLAITLAEKLGHVKLGIDQLELLIKMPESTREQAAKWLALIANWERRLNQNEAKFQALLKQIVRDYPNTTTALSAKRQLQLIANEELERANPRPEVAAPEPIKIRVAK